jgi:hypothetical protein
MASPLKPASDASEGLNCDKFSVFRIPAKELNRIGDALVP